MRYRFLHFELDDERCELACSGKRMAVRPKVFDVLRYLIENRERLVDKDELLDALWKEQAVEEGCVSWTVGHARRALGQRSTDKSPIETVRGRGYRWSAAVEVVGETRLLQAVVPGASFVGRSTLLAALRTRLQEVTGGHGGSAMLIGDAGVGKTRCIDELVKEARGQGFMVWAGSAAPDSMAPVYYPWIQALRTAGCDHPGPCTLAHLLSRLQAHERGSAPLADRDGAAGQLSLFEDVGRALAAHSHHAPLLLVLDDLHWADAGTLELLGFVAAPLRNMRVMLLGASRLPVGSSGMERAGALLRNAERFDVGPLTHEEVAQYVATFTGGITPSRPLCDAVHRVSGGYPLFVRETLRQLATTHGHAALGALSPEQVAPSAHARDALEERLLGLRADTRQALACASVLGDEVDIFSVMRLSKLAHDALSDALDEAIRSGFLYGRNVHGVSFRHDLFREVVYGTIPGRERAQLHRTAALMRAAAPDAARRTNEIALHHHRSLALGHHAEVRVAALDAANAAATALSFNDAARFFSYALEALARDPDATQREYAELMLQRARAQRYGGSTFDLQTTVSELVEVAASHGFGDLLVEAARELRLSHTMGWRADPVALRALGRALELLPESARELRLQARSLLAWLPPDSYDLDRSKEVSATVLEEARQLGHPETLTQALTARLHGLSGPDDIDAQLAVCEEMLALDAATRGWISFEAYTARYRALLLRGDLTGAKVALSAMRKVGHLHGFLEVRWHCDRHVAESTFLAGEFAAAKAQLAQLERDASRMRVQTGERIIGAIRSLVAIATDGPQSFGTTTASPLLDSLLRPLDEYHPNYSVNIARLAVMFGKADLARRVLATVSADDCAQVPKDFLFLQTLCSLGLLAIALEDERVAEHVFTKLVPYAQYNTPNFLGLYEGPVAYFVARIAAFLGRASAAELHFAQALEIDERQGLRPLLAVCSFEYGRWLLAEGRGRHARAPLKRAIALAETLGMDWLGRQARALQTR